MATSTVSAARRVTFAVGMLGLGGAWNAGNVGPVADEIAKSFHLSLAVVGLLSGTLFLGSCAVGLLFAAQLGERTGLVRGLRLACAMLLVGNLLFAITPIFLGLALGRVLPGLAFASINVLGAVWARNAGGVRLLGVFGASIQLGIALALLTGSVLSDLGIDWRVGFVISAALAAVAYASIPSAAAVPAAAKAGGSGFLRAALRHARVYRLSLLFISIYGVPMILSAWLIEYLLLEGDLARSLAGLASFLLFGLSAVMRVFGAQLQQRGVPHAFLGGALAAAAVGLAAITLDPVVAATFVGVVLLALGFGVPYATALSEAQGSLPSRAL